MIVDTQTEFSDSQAVTTTAISANVLDLFSVGLGGGANITPNARLDIGQGAPLYLVVSTAVAATSGSGATTLTVTLESADDAALTTNAQVHASSGAIAKADFATAGSTGTVLVVPPGQYRRYLGVRFTVGTGPLTAGNFDAFLTPTPQLNRPAYKSGFTVQ